MKNKAETKAQLKREVVKLRKKLSELEKSQEKCKRTDEELQTTKRQIEFVLGHTKTGLDIIDSKFNIRYIDPEWKKVYGKPGNKKCYEYFMGRKEMCPNCGIPKALKTKEPVVTEEILIKEKNRPIQVTTIPFRDHNGEWLVAEVNVDITERKQLERELERYREYLEELVKRRTEELKSINEKLQQDITERQRIEEELRRSEQRYRELWDDAPVAYHTLDTKGIITGVNKTEAKMLGYRPQEMIGKSIFDFVIPEQRSDAQRRFTRKISGNHLGRARNRTYIKKDGSEIYVSIDDILEYDSSGKVIGIRTTMVDMTENKRMELGLRESELQYRTTIDSMNEAIHVVGPDLKIILFNNALKILLEGLGLETNVARKTVFEAFPFLSDNIRNEYRLVFETGKSMVTEEHVNVAGREMIAEVRKIPIMEDDETTRVLTVISNITQSRKAEETIRKLAYHDALTGLPNRTLFNNRLALELTRTQRSKKKLSVMLLDLDRFKNVNDTMGHSAGDQLLKEVGKRLSDIVRSSDTVARMGGDEFIILLPDLDKINDTTKIARKILDAIRTPFHIHNIELKITTSLGISVYPYDGEDAETLIKNADISMYKAKDSGRNNYKRYKKSFLS